METENCVLFPKSSRKASPEGAGSHSIRFPQAVCRQRSSWWNYWWNYWWNDTLNATGVGGFRLATKHRSCDLHAIFVLLVGFELWVFGTSGEIPVTVAPCSGLLYGRFQISGRFACTTAEACGHSRCCGIPVAVLHGSRVSVKWSPALPIQPHRLSRLTRPFPWRTSRL